MFGDLRREKPLLLILLLSALLALGYAWATPLGGAPDEGAHLRYIEVLATEGRLPVMDLAQRRANPGADRDFEAHQPPLYYALNVPFYWAGRLLGGEAGIGWACRLLSILIGMLGTLLVWRLTRELAPGKPWLQWTATAFAAFLPMRLSMMASINNDGLTEVFSTLALLVMARILRHGGPASGAAVRDWIQPAALLGGVIALGLMTKATSILLLPPALITLYLASGARDAQRDTGEWQRHFVLGGAALGGVVLLAAGWWFARNQLLYGDPLAKRMFDAYFADTPRWTTSEVRTGFRDELGITFGEYVFRMVLPTTFASFWGAFGHLVKPELFMGGYNPNRLEEPWFTLVQPLEALWPILNLDGKFFIPYKSWVYPLLVLAVLGSITGWVVRKVRRAKPEPGKRGVERNPQAAASESESLAVMRARWVAGIHALFVFAALLNFNATYFQGQGRYLLPAIGVLSQALTGGWLAWAPRREKAAGLLISAGMVGLALYALFGVVLPGFRIS